MPIFTRYIGSGSIHAIDCELAYSLFQANGLATQAAVTQISAPHSWRMISVKSGDSADKDESEEIVMRLQGIICNKDLPPVTKTPR